LKLADTNFENGTVIEADWLNDVNDHVYGTNYSSVNIAEFGAVGDGVTDDSAAFNAAVAAAKAGNLFLNVFLDAKPYLLQETVVIDYPVKFIGQGVYDLENSRGITRPPVGTWLIHDNLTDPMISATSNLGKGAGLLHVGVFQTGHTTPGSGWTPTIHDWVIRNENTQGTFILDSVHFHNVYLGVFTDFSVRPKYENITGQFFSRAFTFDRIYDIGKLDGLHAWTYWSENDNVLAYTQANAISVTLLRVDGLWMDRIFSFGTSIAVYCTNSVAATGTARAITITGIYADFCARALVADPSTSNNAEFQVGAIYHLGQAWPASPTASLPGACAVEISSGNNTLLQIGSIRSNVSESDPVRNRGAGTGNRIFIGDAVLQNYDYTNTGSGAVGTSSGNQVNFASPPLHTNKLGGSKLTSSVTGATAVGVEQIVLAGAVNFVRTTGQSTGLQPVIEGVGEANAGLRVRASGTGDVTIGESGNKLGFYAATPITKPTGVAVNAAGIHAALVSLGLIAA
jgi:hypothetical protein